MPALGYDVVERKLVANPQESAIIQEMFSRFAATPSMSTIVKDLRKRGVTSKSWTTSKGVERQGKLITKGAVYKIFSNPVYIGIAAYKGQHFPGEHDGISHNPRELSTREQCEHGVNVLLDTLLSLADE